jgi:hypothetical protein
MTCVEDKKLSHGLVGDKNLTFCSVPWHLVYPVPGTVFKSNTLLKLSCLVLYFLEKKKGKFNFSNGTQMLYGPMVLELHTRFVAVINSRTYTILISTINFTSENLD